MWLRIVRKNNHRDTENTEVAQRKKSENDFRAKPHQLQLFLRRTLTHTQAFLRSSQTRVVVFDTAFMTDTWIAGPFNVEMIATPEFELARVNKSRRKRSFGIVDIVFVIFEKGRKKIVETQNKIFLPDRKRILEIMKQIGFTPKLYFDFSGTKRSGTVFVFIERKER